MKISSRNPTCVRSLFCLMFWRGGVSNSLYARPQTFNPTRMRLGLGQLLRINGLLGLESRGNIDTNLAQKVLVHTAMGISRKPCSNFVGSQ